ncbi:MAG: serpin family protein [Planctomycetes bacterium]|nr:serpin family protein [Planctomycetota bacterium]
MSSRSHKFLYGVPALLLLSLFAAPALPAAAADAELQRLASDQNAFALDLYSRLKQADGNIFYSPFSISTALAMTYAGARNDTAREMAAAMRFPPGSDAFHASVGRQLADLMPRRKAPYSLNIANALWGDRDFSFLDAFLDLNRSCYGAGLSRLDFRADPEKARRTINSWIEEQTRDKIRDMLKKGDISADTRLVLTNAIYFKGSWLHAFDEAATRNDSFVTSSGKPARIRMMFLNEDFPYAEDSSVQVLELPYRGDRLSMVVILPRSPKGLPQVEASLDGDRLNAWIAALRSRSVHVFLPRFTMNCRFSMGQTLASMGMPSAFDPGAADFSGMTGNRDLFISNVVHQAFVDVNEEGTEAAAATAVIMECTCAPAQPLVFRADHPFIFLIRDRRTSAILFMGRMTAPERN